eukprot:4870677-Alexandrium_andersonii.AAC.1
MPMPKSRGIAFANGVKRSAMHDAPSGHVMEGEPSVWPRPFYWEEPSTGRSSTKIAPTKPSPMP